MAGKRLRDAGPSTDQAPQEVMAVVSKDKEKKVKKEVKGAELKKLKERKMEVVKKKRKKKMAFAAGHSNGEVVEGGNGVSVEETVVENDGNMKERKRKKKKVAVADSHSGLANVGLGEGANAAAAAAAGEPVGLQIFWNLSGRDEQAREIASVALVKELTESQRAWEESGKEGKLMLGAGIDDALLPGCAPGVRYALCRLIRGLGSSRDSVRQGFAAALAAVLNVLTCVDEEAILKLVNKELEVTSSMKGLEVRDLLLGRLFAFGALIRGMWRKGVSQELAKDVSQQLLCLAGQKVFLREPAVCLLVEFAEPLSAKFLKGSVFAAPLFQEWILAKPDSSSPDALLLALKLHQKLPAGLRESCALLPNSDNLSAFFEPQHLSSLITVFREASCSHPRVHSMWPTLLHFLLPKGDVEGTERKRKKKSAAGKSERGLESRLKTFWQVVVEGALLTSSHERKHLAMELLLLLLPSLSPPFVPMVLTGAFVRCLLTILNGEKNLLFKSAQKCLQELSLWADQDNELAMAVVMSLQGNTFGRFDANSKTQTVRSLVRKLAGGRTCKIFIDSLMQFFLKGSPEENEQRRAFSGGIGPPDTPLSHRSGDVDADEEEATMQNVAATDLNKVWVLDQLCSVFKVVQMEPEARSELQKEVLRFLAMHGLFDPGVHAEEMKTELGEKLEWPQGHISSRVRDIFVSRLSTFLVDVQRSAVAPSIRKTQVDEVADRQVLQREDYGVFVAGFLERVQKLEGISFVRPMSVDVRNAVSNLHAAIDQMTKAVSKSDEEMTEKLKAMRAFLVQLLFQLYVDPGAVQEVVTELMLFCEQVFGQYFEEPLAVVRADEDEVPHSMDVLVDILLSVLTQPSARIRATAEQVFRPFAGDLTPQGVQTMLHVLRKQPEAVRHKPSFGIDKIESDEDEVIGFDDDSEGSEDEADDGKSEGVDEEEDEEDSDDNGETMNDKDKAKTKSVEAAESGSSVKSDSSEDEDEVLSDMDDEQMFKMDVHLSKILQQRKTGVNGGEKKDAQSQLAEFKLRTLSLLEIFLSKQPSSSLVLDVLPSLLQQLVISSTADGNAQLAGRIGSIIQSKILKGKHYPKGSGVTLPAVKELLQKTLNLASRTSKKQVGKIAQGSFFWLLKVLHGNWSESELKDDAFVGQLVADSLRDFFLKKKCRLSLLFFSEVLTRHPWLGNSVVGILLEHCKSARTEFLQCQAMQLVSGFVRTKGGKGRVPGDNMDGSLAAALEPHLKQLGDSILALFQKPLAKSSKRSEALGYCMFCLEALPQICPKVRLEDVVDRHLLLSSLKALEVPLKGNLSSRLKKLEDALRSSLEDSNCSTDGLKKRKSNGRASVLKGPKRKVDNEEGKKNVNVLQQP